MAHVFDTGLPKAQRTMVRDAVIAKLAPLLKANGGYLKTVKPVARIVKSDHEANDEYGMALLANAANGNTPCVLVALGRADYDEFNTEDLELTADLEVGVYACSGHARSREEGRLAADVSSAASVAADPGLEVAVEHVEERIVGQDLGIDKVDPPKLKFTDSLYTGDDFTFWELRFVVRCYRTTNPDRDVTQLLLEIEADNKLDGLPSGDPDDPIATLITTITEVPPAPEDP